MHQLPFRGIYRNPAQHVAIATPDMDVASGNSREINCLQSESSPAREVARTIAYGDHGPPLARSRKAGAPGRSRTCMALRPTDFKSVASTHSATGASSCSVEARVGSES